MRRCSLIAIVIAISLSFLSTADAQRRGRRDPGTLDQKKFSRVIDRLRDKSELLEFQRGQLAAKFPDRRQVSKFCQKVMGPINKSAGRSFEQAYADANCELTIGKDAEVTLRVGDNRLQSNQYEREHVDLDELNAPFRLFEIAKTPEHLQLFYQDPTAPTAFWLIQSDDQAQIVFIEGPTAVRYAAASLSELATRYDLSDIVEKARGFGFDLGPLGLSSGLNELVGRILELSDEDFAAFKEKWSALESTGFKARDAAITELREDFDKWSAAVAYAALGYGQSSVQFKASLNRVISNEDEADTTVNLFDQVKAVVNNRLTEDPPLLINLLRQLQASETDRESAIEKTVRQLEKITGQKFDANAAEWQKWLISSEIAKHQPMAKVDGSSLDYVRWGTARTSLSKLVNLTVGEDDKWQVNQKAWQQEFGIEDIQGLLKETIKRYRSTRLPTDWLRMGSGFDTNCVDFPQVLFELYKEQLEKPVRRRNDDFESHFGRSTFNRVLESYGLTARLDMHPPSKGREPIDRQYLSLNIHDPTSLESRLRLFEKDGQTSLLLRSGPRNELLWLFQNKDGSSWIHHAGASGLTSCEASTGRKLFEDNKEMFDKTVYPLFSEMGVNVGAAVGGPLEFRDVPLEIKARK